MKRQGSTELPRFAVGALAIAGASAANGATVVQISFANNVVSMSSGLGNFVADLTGDLTNDVRGQVNPSRYAIVRGRGALYLSSDLGAAYTDTGGNVNLGGLRANESRGYRQLVPFLFTDKRINSGVVTGGFLDLEGVATGSSASLQIHRMIFDANSTTAPTGLTSASTGIAEWSAPSGGGTSAVPEASSSLGLLALGAGGLLTRRRQKRAA
jgi:hypothetical protein